MFFSESSRHNFLELRRLGEHFRWPSQLQDAPGLLFFSGFFVCLLRRGRRQSPICRGLPLMLLHLELTEELVLAAVLGTSFSCFCGCD